jgi:LysM repeat protein
MWNSLSMPGIVSNRGVCYDFPGEIGMTRWKRLFYYLAINVLVSACTILAILNYWQRTHPGASGDIGFLHAIPTSTLSMVQSTLVAGPVEPTPTSTPVLITYTVEAGETLSEIALKYGITIEEIMKLNGLSDPKSLGTGQVLFIPIPPGFSLTSTPEDGESSATAALEGTPVVTSTGSAPEAHITISTVIGAGDLPTEKVRLEWNGQGDLSLLNWKLKDENKHVYTFPQLTLYSGGTVDLYTGSGVNEVSALYWGLNEPIWKTGELVTLLDDQGRVQAKYTIP